MEYRQQALLLYLFGTPVCRRLPCVSADIMPTSTFDPVANQDILSHYICLHRECCYTLQVLKAGIEHNVI